MGKPRKVKPDLSHITQDLHPLAVPIESVVKDPDNLRLHPERSIEGIRGSLAKFTQRKPIVVNKRTGVIEAGNGTIEALLANGQQYVAAVFVDDDPVTATAYAIADNRTAELSMWNVPALKMTVEALDDFDIPGIDQDFLDGLTTDIDPEVGDEDDGGFSDNYTRKIEAPVYTPSDPVPPPPRDLYDRSKSAELQKQIEEADLDPELRQFLLAAAERHTTFRFDRIAEFYAHASPEIQDLMERSALIVIDFERAVELGFVKLAETLLKQAGVDKAAEEARCA